MIVVIGRLTIISLHRVSVGRWSNQGKNSFQSQYQDQSESILYPVHVRYKGLIKNRWQKSELHELSRRGQSEVRAEKRSRAWKLWNRDQKGLCGIQWLTRRLLIFTIFFLCIGYVYSSSQCGNLTDRLVGLVLHYTLRSLEHPVFPSTNLCHLQ